MDELDEKIIEALMENSKATYKELAEKLKMKESTVRKRVLNLIEKKVIKKFTIIVDPVKLGKNAIAIIGVEVDPSTLLNAAQKLSEIPEAKFVATSTGDHMIMMEVWAKNGKELTQIISEKIAKINGVKKICPSIILEKIKE
ncbi:Lrp/AsnC family transcriptional regulator [Candidatus Bathyarchaeota archaeon]|nr:Lrp/AsnC family transcriptional regulator [Candidatus Bathyarchaeota archaeon]